jgi:hypothetical protein
VARTDRGAGTAARADLLKPARRAWTWREISVISISPASSTTAGSCTPTPSGPFGRYALDAGMLEAGEETHGQGAFGSKPVPAVIIEVD